MVAGVMARVNDAPARGQRLSYVLCMPRTWQASAVCAAVVWSAWLAAAGGYLGLELHNERLHDGHQWHRDLPGARSVEVLGAADLEVNLIDNGLPDPDASLEALGERIRAQSPRRAPHPIWLIARQGALRGHRAQ